MLTLAFVRDRSKLANAPLVVVVGGGYGGITAAQGLEKQGFNVVVRCVAFRCASPNRTVLLESDDQKGQFASFY